MQQPQTCTPAQSESKVSETQRAPPFDLKPTDVVVKEHVGPAGPDPLLPPRSEKHQVCFRSRPGTRGLVWVSANHDKLQCYS